MAKLWVKNMVCNRCIMVLQGEMEKLELKVKHIQLGEISLEEELTQKQRDEVAKILLPLGFELINNKKSQIVEKIKTIIIELVHHQEEEMKMNLSGVLSEKLNQDYNTLSHLFSETEGTTIEKYFIAQRIEKVKELLVYGELSLSEIAMRLNYSSVAYLSNQFKKVMGLTPSFFKQMKKNKRQSLDKI